MTLDQLMISKREHESWLAVVKLLKETGAVTDSDCEMAIGQAPETDGQKLFVALRVWGRWMARLGRDGIHDPEKTGGAL